MSLKAFSSPPVLLEVIKHRLSWPMITFFLCSLYSLVALFVFRPAQWHLNFPFPLSLLPLSLSFLLSLSLKAPITFSRSRPSTHLRYSYPARLVNCLSLYLHTCFCVRLCVCSLRLCLSSKCEKHCGCNCNLMQPFIITLYLCKGIIWHFWKYANLLSAERIDTSWMCMCIVCFFYLFTEPG